VSVAVGEGETAHTIAVGRSNDLRNSTTAIVPDKIHLIDMRASRNSSSMLALAVTETSWSAAISV
jgi:hypothetical protein